MMPKKAKSNNYNPTAPPPPWIELPKDLALNILRRLNQVEILESVQYVCTTWKNLCSEPSLWRVIDANRYGKLSYSYHDVLCCRAVDRSQGELNDICIGNFGSDQLLHYISYRSIHLKRLTLQACERVSPEGLMAALKKFPYLEELHLCYIEPDFDVDMETIAISCPFLNSFSFNKSYPELEVNNSEAISIAKSMPDLCRLGLVGNCLNNQGLQAILNGCLNLRLLDLRMCFHVDLESDLWKRCSERIEELRWGPDNGLDDDDDYAYAFDDAAAGPHDDDEEEEEDDYDYGDDDIVYVDLEDDCYEDGNESDDDF